VSFPVQLARSWPLLRLVAPMTSLRTDEDLAKIVQSEIIPRLMLAHQPEPIADETLMDMDMGQDRAAGAEATEAFARMVFTRAPEALMGFIESLVRSGVTLQTIYAELLAPTARLLAQLWDQDRVSYTEVTIGLGRLQQLVHALEAATPYNGENDAESRSVMFAPRPGEQQTFGFYIMEELFRWSGWRALIETYASNAQIVSTVQFRWFDMFCLSVCRENHIEEVTATIKAIRRASRNQDLYMMVYGQPFVEHPELVEAVGADASASCAGEALDMADKAVWRAATDE
jgi:methanogenic corrinoid protein MtbC1